MKKKLLVITLCCMSLVILCACSQKKDDISVNSADIQEEIHLVENEKNESISLDEEIVIEKEVYKDTDIVTSHQVNKKVPVITDNQPKVEKKEQQLISSEINVDIKTEAKEPEHIHEWKEIYSNTIHDEIGHYEEKLIKEGSTDYIPIYEYSYFMVCNQCGHKMYSGSDVDVHYKTNYDCSSWRDECISEVIDMQVIEHQPVYETVYIIDKEAWTETTLTGYTCECGAIK